MGVEVFQCNWGSSLKSFLSAKNQEKLFLQIDDTKPDGVKVTGKGYICNEEGKNEYLSQYDYPAKDIKDVKKGEFQGSDALVIVTKLQTLYGAKKTQTILPGIKDIDRAFDTLTRVAKEAGGLMGDAPKNARPAAAAPAPTPAPAAPAPKPAAPKPTPAPAAPKPAPAPTPMPAAPAPAAPAPAAPAPSEAPAFSAINPMLGKTPAAAAPVPAAPAPAAPAPAAPAPAAPAPKANKESYEQKLKKLDIMHESGMCTDDEYKEKKLKLICDEKGLGAFCDKIQKIFVMKKSGMLSDAEFESNKNQIIDECFAVDVKDLNVFKENMTKLPIILMSELIAETEYNEKKQKILDSVAYNPMDSNDLFCLKLQKMPILRDAEMIPASEYDNDIKELKALLDPKASDSIDALDMKLAKWPPMVTAGCVSDAEYKEKQQKLTADVMAMQVYDEASFKSKAERVMKLKEKGWITELDFHGKKVELLKNISIVEDYVLRMKFYMVAKTSGLISQDDYDAKKSELIKDVFSPYADMDEFQKKVNMLMKLNQADIITNEEYSNYKNKLMSDL